MLHGWIILDKPVGFGSTTAVSAVKRILRQAGEPKTKVGHGGTLDPLASGVLPIALGEATKLCGRMLDATKAYEFTIRFGEETDTLDAEGKVITTSDVRPSLEEIEVVLPRFTGEIEQVPPAYSALKIGGRAAYERARAGEELEMKSRHVTVHNLSIQPDSCSRANDEATLSATVSKGTYIRSLARDIAHALRTVGHVTHLRRTRAGPFSLGQAISLDKLNAIGQGAALENVLLPLEAGLDGIPALDLGPEQARAVRQGRVLTGLDLPDGVCWARSGGTPLALLQIATGEARVLRGFNLADAAE